MGDSKLKELILKTYKITPHKMKCGLQIANTFKMGFLIKPLSSDHAKDVVFYIINKMVINNNISGNTLRTMIVLS